MKQDYSIYTLSDPRDNSVRYVGRSMHPYVRYGQHLALVDANHKKADWIRELTTLQMIPTLEIIEVLSSKEDAVGRELHWIRHYLNLGAGLTNVFHRERPIKDNRQWLKQETQRLAQENGWSLDTAYRVLTGG